MSEATPVELQSLDIHVTVLYCIYRNICCCNPLGLHTLRGIRTVTTLVVSVRMRCQF